MTEMRCKKPSLATLQRFHDFVLQATRFRDGYALQCALTELKDDREVVMVAMAMMAVVTLATATLAGAMVAVAHCLLVKVV